MERHRSMRRYASAWDMSKREGFTLIEVMVSVMIISVVVTAFLQLQSTNTVTFERLQKMQRTLQYISLLQGSKYGYENDTLTLDRAVERFDLDDDLRRELKAIQADILYERLDRIDTAEFEDSFGENNQSEGGSSPLVIEIGRTVLQLSNESISIMRIRIP